jgi:phosphoribosylformylglycinamidine cyclo-ligase
MPGLYHGDDYDLAGFAVGAAERRAMLPSGVAQGQVVLGLASSGIHSNGFSLVRQIVAGAKAGWGDPAPFAAGRTLAEALMEPTRIYVKSVLALHRAGLLRGAAHITGGGLPGNLPRALPDGTRAVLDSSSWPRPAVMDWLAERGGVAPDEMLRVFNCGIGMALIVEDSLAATAVLEEHGETVFTIGHIELGSGPPSVTIQ